MFLQFLWTHIYCVTIFNKLKTLRFLEVSYPAQVWLVDQVSHMVRDHPKVLEDCERCHPELLALVGDVMTDGIESG